jgi:hypothetical protein
MVKIEGNEKLNGAISEKYGKIKAKRQNTDPCLYTKCPCQVPFSAQCIVKNVNLQLKRLKVTGSWNI